MYHSQMDGIFPCITVNKIKLPSGTVDLFKLGLINGSMVMFSLGYSILQSIVDLQIPLTTGRVSAVVQTVFTVL